MASNDGKAPIIVKKVVKGGGDGHHGGAWKVAYADFVTAMMAFFLLMWLLNATTEQQRKGLADYFDPSIPLASISGGGIDVLSGDTVMAAEARAGSTRDEAPRAPEDTEADPPETAEALAAAEAAKAAALAATERALAEAIEASGGELERHFVLRTSPEGLVIEIVEQGDAPLFASGSAVAGPRLARLIEVLVPVLAMTANPLKVVGHTDARPFGSGGVVRGYDNWSLSADRADTARRLMKSAGLTPARIVEVSGRAATEPLVEDALAAQNRRIAVTLLR
ncbi:MAG: flagellar motor protein MotB [Pseudomonadota bacterium]